MKNGVALQTTISQVIYLTTLQRKARWLKNLKITESTIKTNRQNTPTPTSEQYKLPYLYQQIMLTNFIYFYIIIL